MAAALPRSATARFRKATSTSPMRRRWIRILSRNSPTTGCSDDFGPRRRRSRRTRGPVAQTNRVVWAGDGCPAAVFKNLLGNARTAQEGLAMFETFGKQKLTAILSAVTIGAALT